MLKLGTIENQHQFDYASLVFDQPDYEGQIKYLCCFCWTTCTCWMKHMSCANFKWGISRRTNVIDDNVNWAGDVMRGRWQRVVTRKNARCASDSALSVGISIARYLAGTSAEVTRWRHADNDLRGDLAARRISRSPLFVQSDRRPPPAPAPLRALRHPDLPLYWLLFAEAIRINNTTHSILLTTVLSHSQKSSTQSKHFWSCKVIETC